MHIGSVLLTLDGVNDVSIEEKLRFTKLYAKEEDLPKLPKGEYYFFQLTGLTAILPDGEDHFSTDKHRRVDDYPYRPGGGMVMQTQPICDGYKSAAGEEKPHVILCPPRERL